MTRFVAVFVAVGVSIAGAGLLWAAETGMLPGGGKITWDKFFIKQNGSFSEPKDQDARRRYLNLAHCTCAKANAGDETEAAYDLKLSSTTTSSTTGEIWVGGPMCDMDTVRSTNCRQLSSKTIADLAPLAIMPYRLSLNVFDVINGTKNMDACAREEGSKLVWLLAKNNGTYVYTNSQGLGERSDDMIKVDTKPPEALTSISAASGDGAIEIKWNLSESNQADYYYMQALCSYTDDNPVFSGDAVPSPKYQTAKQLCGETGDFKLDGLDISLPGEDAVSTVPFGDLQPTFLCGEATPAGGSLRIEGLENGTPYKVALLAMDLHGNVIGSYLKSTVTPRPVTDFWEELNNRDSAVQGGCLLSTTYGDGNPLTRWMRSFRDGTLARSAAGRWLTEAYYATLGKLQVTWLPARILVGLALLPLVALALLWHLLGLPALLALLALLVWRRQLARLLRRWRLLRLAAPAAVAAILLAPGLAAADDFTPYWEDPAQEDPALQDAGVVKWQVGIRVGPYIPDIDLQFDQNAATGLGPYAAMFGTYYSDDGMRHKQHVYQILPMLDVDRIVWRGFGQLGVGGSLGYMQKSAYAYASGTTEDDGEMRLRSSDKTTFRLIPLAATVMYRLTYADDRWGIPVIPYVRGGLAYYMWWMKGANGTSKVCDEANPKSCDKAYGGTPGVQVSAGLAVRAERVDAAAARSMRNSGIEHAGFYGEVFWGRVDGFGSSSRLWVGDTTWFAGANFEF